ncbi:MAG: M48 family metallopeptidase [Robiginitomaculum sp.]
MKLFLLITFLLAGCASVETRLPTPNAISVLQERRMQEEHALARYENLRERLDRVSSTVLQKNATLCDKTRSDIGIITHREKSYPKQLRKSAARWLGAKKNYKVFIVREGSLAKKAGVRAGDILLSTDGKPVSAQNKDALQNGAIIVKRGETILNLALSPPRACAYTVRLKISGAINAYADGKNITVTTAMMDFAKTDEDLALVIGHELAHNTMGHVAKSIQNYILSGFTTRYTRPFEAEADYVGLYYTANAGYDLSTAENFWRRLGLKNPKSIVHAKTHPTTTSRSLSIKLTKDEITKKRAMGKALVPNFTKQQKFQKQ